MVTARQVVDEHRPMVSEFLMQLGLVDPGTPLRFDALAEPFSKWISDQEIGRDDIPFVAARVAAFVGEYLVETRAASYSVENNRIAMIVPLEQGIVRQYELYPFAMSVTEKRISLADLLQRL